MNKLLLIALCFFSPSLSSIYAPMSTRTFDFQVDDICKYQKTSTDFIYVEPCEKDYSCESIYSSGSQQIGVCRKNVQEEISFFGSSCEEDDDCYGNIKCVDKKCTLEENDTPLYLDKYYCPDSLIPVQTDSGNYKCEKRDKNEMDGLCYLKTESGTIKNASPDYLKVCGEISLDKAENNYAKLKTSVNSLGSIDNGKFVEDPMACKSAFTLFFYPNGKISNPSPTTVPNTPYQMCIQFNGIEYKKSGSCKINYIIGENKFIYDFDKTDISAYSSPTSICSYFKVIEARLDLLNQYINKVNELGDECIKSNFYDEPHTCRNDEVRKLYYFYNHIDEYLLYKNEDEISEYILQEIYPSYGVKFSKTDGSNYLSNKFICLLILFLL